MRRFHLVLVLDLQVVCSVVGLHLLEFGLHRVLQLHDLSIGNRVLATADLHDYHHHHDQEDHRHWNSNAQNQGQVY
jgi:hypothetical protein